MIKPKAGFIVFGVHKDGLTDPMGTPFIDDNIVRNAKKALINAGLELIEHEVVLATKKEAKECLGRFKKMDGVDAIILFSGTWVWASHLIAAVRDFASTGKGIVLWTVPGSQGWRPVGGFVMQGAFREIGLKHRYVYGNYDDPKEIERITSYCRASALKHSLNMSTIGTFGGRGMGQTCGAAIRRRDEDVRHRYRFQRYHRASKYRRNISRDEISKARRDIGKYFSEPIPENEQADRSISLYLAIRKLVRKYNWDFYTIQSFPVWAMSTAPPVLPEHDAAGRNRYFHAGDFNTALTMKCLTTSVKNRCTTAIFSMLIRQIMRSR